MRYIFLLIITLVLTPLSFGQDSLVSDEPYEDEVVAIGTISKADPAMGAFARGDYATAEIEFTLNYQFIQRADRARANAFQNLSNSSLSAQVANGPGEVSGGGQNITPSANVNGSNAYKPTPESTKFNSRVPQVNDIGFQFYMRGLSQIQLGKYDEAQESFERALNFNNRLYDAKFRLGILELRNGDRDAAEAWLSELERNQKWCKYCDGKQEINSGIAILSASLGY